MPNEVQENMGYISYLGNRIALSLLNFTVMGFNYYYGSKMISLLEKIEEIAEM